MTPEFIFGSLMAVFALMLIVQASTGSFVDDARWSEAEMAAGVIKTAADTYSSKFGKDALNSIAIPAAPLSVSGAQWTALGFDTGVFKSMLFWDARAFSFSTPAVGEYTIIVNTANLGSAGDPPDDSGGITVVVNAYGATWIRHGSSQ